ncbi:hypothetical protein LSAT2_027361 [Lamellibrachia satsuma]|nr:hypothetical protein LSAT2_027361 [Lamellibrachia satsuma]
MGGLASRDENVWYFTCGSRKMGSKEIKSGLVKYYKQSFYGLYTRWKNRYLVLCEDSALTWYTDSSKGNLKGSLKIEPVCDFLAYGPLTLSVSGRPAQPKGRSYLELLSVTKDANWNSPREWFLFISERELRSWMAAIVSTLSHTPAHLTVTHQSTYGQPMNYGSPQGFGQNTNAGTGMILGATALGMGASMLGIPFIGPGMSDFGGTVGGFDLI